MLDNTVTVILLMLIAAIYLLPTIFAYARDLPQRHVIALINILFGWTLLVWVIAFVWALAAPAPVDEYG